MPHTGVPHIPVDVLSTGGTLEQRHLTDTHLTVVLVGAGVGFEAMLACGGGGLAVADDVFHGGDIGSYLVVASGQFLGEVCDDEIIDAAIYNIKCMHFAAVGDDIVLQGSVALVGLAEDIATLHLVDIQCTILVLVYHVGQHQHIVV